MGKVGEGTLWARRGSELRFSIDFTLVYPVVDWARVPKRHLVEYPGPTTAKRLSARHLARPAFHAESIPMRRRHDQADFL